MSARSRLHTSAIAIPQACLTTRAKQLRCTKNYTHQIQLYCIQNTLVLIKNQVLEKWKRLKKLNLYNSYF